MLLLLLLTLLGIYLFHELYWKRRGLPRGPTPLPFIGNLLSILLNEPGYDAFSNWKKQYGPIYTFWLANRPMIVICDYEAMKNTFVKDADSYIGKFNREVALHVFRGGYYGIIDTSDEIWREHRRFALQVFRNLGFGKNLMEQKILYEVEALTEELQRMAKSGSEFSMQHCWDTRVGCVINNMLFGYRFDEKTISEFRYLKKLLSEAMRQVSEPATTISLMYPSTRYIPFGPIGETKWQKMLGYWTAFMSFFDDQIAAHRVDYEEEESRDYVEAYFKEKRKREEVGDYESYSIPQLKSCLFDLWVGGLETTSNTLTWMIVYVMHHSCVQDKIHEELDKVIDSRRDISTADRAALPYVNAVINETQRLANLLPMNLIHELSNDVELEGCKLKRGTAVVAQISAVLYDEKVFAEPYEFRPARFLDANGNLKKIEELIPFSIGKRQCLGEGLAKMELFLFTANLFNRFKISCSSLPSLKKHFGTTVQPLPFSVFVEERS